MSGHVAMRQVSVERLFGQNRDGSAPGSPTGGRQSHAHGQIAWETDGQLVGP
jgi:hypothetical protein